MSHAYVDVMHVPLVRSIQRNYIEIKSECLNLFFLEGDIDKVNAPMAGQDGRNMASVGKPKYEGRNSSLHLRVVRDLLDPPEARFALCAEGDRRRALRRQRCPILWGLLEPYGDQIGNVGFNKLFPGGHITPHYGVITASNYVRVHLCIVQAEGAVFYAEGSDSYTWKDGEVMAFNDGTTLHWVNHYGTTPRTILSVDLKREMVFPEGE